jgi:hypothetical protein
VAVAQETAAEHRREAMDVGLAAVRHGCAPARAGEEAERLKLGAERRRGRLRGEGEQENGAGHDAT